MKERMIRALLGFSGLIALGIGIALLFQPHAFFASNGIVLDYDPSLLSEVRAPGGLLIGCAVAIWVSTFKYGELRFALVLSTTLYGLYGISRSISMLIDGLPSTSLIAATAIELLLSGLCLIALNALHQTKVNSGGIDTVEVKSL